jgi:hypothetical protein
MDYFKIFTIIFMIAILYKLYLAELKDMETFSNAEQSIGGVDDANSINTLAQLARKLLDGGATVPGNLNVKGNVSTAEGIVSINNGTINLTSDGGGGLYFLKSGTTGAPVYNKLFTGEQIVNGNLTINGTLVPAHSVWHKSTDGLERLHYGNNTHTFYRTGDSHVFRNRADKDVVVIDGNGVLYAQGRNILAELNNLNENAILQNQRVRLKAPDAKGRGDLFKDMGDGGGLTGDGNWHQTRIVRM